MEQKSRRNLLSIVFMLAMVIGLMTGMSMTAYAEEDEDGTYVYIDVGTGHAKRFDDRTLEGLQEKTQAEEVWIIGNIITLNGIPLSETQGELLSSISDFLEDLRTKESDDYFVHNSEFFAGTGYRPLDEYKSFQEIVWDIKLNTEHSNPITPGFKYYLVWWKPFPDFELDNGNPTCGKKAEDAMPTLPDGTEFYCGDFEDQGYTWEDEDEDEVDVFEGGKEYSCTVKIRVDLAGAFWKYYFNEEYLNVKVTGGKDVSIDPDEPQLLVVRFKATADHVWDAGKVTKEPTSSDEGEKTYKCKNCGATKTEAIPKKPIEPTPEDTTQTEAEPKKPITPTPDNTTQPQQTEGQITIIKRPVLKKPEAKKMRATVFWNAIKRKTKNQKKIWEQIMQIEVQCSADPAFPKEVTDSRIIGKKKTKVVFNGLQRKTAYFVRARYLDGAGGYSAWSKVKKMKTK